MKPVIPQPTPQTKQDLANKKKQKGPLVLAQTLDFLSSDIITNQPNTVDSIFFFAQRVAHSNRLVEWSIKKGVNCMLVGC